TGVVTWNLSEDLDTATTGTCSVKVTVDDYFPFVGCDSLIINTCRISTETFDSDSINDVFSDTLILCTFRDVTIDKTLISPIGLEPHEIPGQQLTYELRVQNTGNVEARDVTIKEYLSQHIRCESVTVTCNGSSIPVSPQIVGGQCRISWDVDIPAGGEKICTIEAEVLDADSIREAIGLGTFWITNICSVSTVPPEIESDITNNTDIDSLEIEVRGGLGVDKRVLENIAHPGGNLTYVIEYANIGNVTASASFSDTLPPYTSPVRPITVNCTEGTGTIPTETIVNDRYVIEWDVIGIPIGVTGYCTLKVTVDNCLPWNIVQLTNTLHIISGVLEDVVSVSIPAEPDSFSIFIQMDPSEIILGECTTITVGWDRPLQSLTVSPLDTALNPNSPDTVEILYCPDEVGVIEICAVGQDSCGNSIENCATLIVKSKCSMKLNKNGFNPSSENLQIDFSTLGSGETELKIYNIAGELVKTFQVPTEAGKHTEFWYGKNNDGEIIASGVYIVILKAIDCEKMKKVAVVR
ncbi:MAG: FlgD immunoglobulin-like domain containing protein, partial [bacterium]